MWDRPQIRYMGLTKQGQRGSAICGKKMKMKKKNGERIITPRGLVCAEDNFH